MSDPKQRLDHGSKFPYDAGSNFWEGDGNSTPPQALDWAHAAARGILADLLDRRGVQRLRPGVLLLDVFDGAADVYGNIGGGLGVSHGWLR